MTNDTSEMLLDWFVNIARDYHRDFNHAKNLRHTELGWEKCGAERCKRFRQLIDYFPETVRRDAEAELKKVEELIARLEAAKQLLGTAAQS